MAKKLDDHLKEKGFYFVAVSHDLKQCEEMIKVLPDFTSWAYIRHEPDSEEGSPHYHFLVHHNGTRSVGQIADKLGISGQFVQVCRKVVAYRRYMMHLDNDEKIKYSLEDIHSNHMPDFKAAVIGNDKKDINDLYKDWKRVVAGDITASEFVQLNYVELSKMNFYQKIKTFELLSKYAHNTT